MPKWPISEWVDPSFHCQQRARHHLQIPSIKFSEEKHLHLLRTGDSQWLRNKTKENTCLGYRVHRFAFPLFCFLTQLHYHFKQYTNEWRWWLFTVAKSCLVLVTPWTVAHQTSLSMGFPGKRGGCHFLLQEFISQLFMVPVMFCYQGW